MAALRAAADRTRSITPTRAGAATWTSASATATSASRRSSRSTTPTTWSRSTPASGCASRRGSWAPGASAPVSSGPGSTRTGATRRWPRSRSGPRFRRLYETRSTITPAAEVRLDAGPQRRRRREHHRAGAAAPARSSQMANAAVASIDFDRRWKDGVPTRTHHVAAQLRRARRHAAARKRSRLHAIPRRGLVSIRLRTPPRPGDRHGRRHHGTARRSSSGSRSATRRRCAAGTSTTSRRRAATACSTRRSSTATPGSRSSSTSARCGTRTPNSAVRVSTGFGFHAGPAFFVVGFPAEHRQPERHLHDGSADSRGRDPVVAARGSASRDPVAPPRWCCSPCSRGRPRACGAGGDRRHRRRCAEDPRAGLQLPEGRAARPIEGRPIGARGARRAGAPGTGEAAGGRDPPGLRLELRSLGGAIRRDHGGRALAVGLAPDAGGRRGVVRRAARRSRSARSARWAATCRSGFGWSTASWTATAPRIRSRLGLHACRHSSTC